MPLDIIQGLPYLKMTGHTDKEWGELPHVILTGAAQWDPRKLDHSMSDRDGWYDSMKQDGDGLADTLFDELGNYRHRSPPEPY